MLHRHFVHFARTCMHVRIVGGWAGFYVQSYKIEHLLLWIFGSSNPDDILAKLQYIYDTKVKVKSCKYYYSYSCSEDIDHIKMWP